MGKDNEGKLANSGNYEGGLAWQSGSRFCAHHFGTQRTQWALPYGTVYEWQVARNLLT